MNTSDPAPNPRALSRRELHADDDFDNAYSDWVRRQSERHWTPVEVARLAADLLVTSEYTRVLDVGSGAGKFCIVGALTTRKGRFYGVEQRADLVHAARQAARQYGVEPRVHFIQADITSIDWREFNAFYFFNPFSEPIEESPDAGVPFCGDTKAALHLRHYYIQFARTQLAAAPSGTRVVTYYGLGGQLPPCYQCVRREGRGTDFVELWVKQPTGAWVPSVDPEADESERRRSGAGAQG
jgi:SAM-dependent methyltransferase